jgi:hypothetical protein
VSWVINTYARHIIIPINVDGRWLLVVVVSSANIVLILDHRLDDARRAKTVSKLQVLLGMEMGMGHLAGTSQQPLNLLPCRCVENVYCCAFFLFE